MAYYWIKLYHEILHDPKMGRLSDPLWRRTIELFLMAGESGKDGHLPSISEMAWTCRVSEDRMVDDLKALETLNIVHKTQDGWVVTNFEKRQDAATSAERQQEKRKRDRTTSQVVTKNVQELKIEVESESESEAEVEVDPLPATANLDRLISWGVGNNKKTQEIASDPQITPMLIDAHAKRLTSEKRFTPGLLVTCLLNHDPVSVSRDRDTSRYGEWEQ